ncbi:hypothetical protein T10_727 [Trichinella papuae]|uniref:MULE transposase domain-containing protein n=1 Tax=Trichinella papuae TaxID=268474 RepID=A0A0V1N0I6_9BILA|nr:hypothetical protein T10_727 [Trichinella papuae]
MYRSRAKRFPPLPARNKSEIPAHWRVTKSVQQFLMFNNVHNSVVIFCTEENLRELAGHSVRCMDGTFKIVPEWYQQMFTIHVFKRQRYGVVLQPQTVICDFETALIPAVQASVLGVQIQVSAFFDYFQREWMTPNRLPLWNAYNVNIRKKNHLDGWHFRMNWQVRIRHMGFYEVRQLLAHR